MRDSLGGTLANTKQTKSKLKWFVQFVFPWMVMGVDDKDEKRRKQIGARYMKHSALAVATLYLREFGDGAKARAYCPSTGEYHAYMHETEGIKEYNGRESKPPRKRKTA